MPPHPSIGTPVHRDTAAARVWADPDAAAVCLVALGLDRYGTECLRWLPETWAAEIEADCGVPPHPRALSRLLAGCLVMTSPDEFYRTPEGFTDLVEALAGVWFDPAVARPPSTAEVLLATLEAYLLDPPDESPPFSPEVNRYACLVAKNDGFPKLPDALRSFGFTPDPTVEADYDYAEDPDLFAAVAAAVEDREADLSAVAREYFSDLASQVDNLPLRHTNHGVGDMLRRLSPPS